MSTNKGLRGRRYYEELNVNSLRVLTRSGPASMPDDILAEECQLLTGLGGYEGGRTVGYHAPNGGIRNNGRVCTAPREESL